MKRIHLFEFEDFSWFPNFLRMGMTRCIIVFHRLVGTREAFAGLLSRALNHTGTKQIVDLCSGSGGIMPEVLEQLRTQDEFSDVQLTLTDLYPSPSAAEVFNGQPDSGIRYETASVDATQVGDSRKGLRTMVASFHHMKPDLAQKILEDAQNSQQPYCMIDPGDNKPPTLLGFIGLPFVFISCLLITPFVRPLTFTQLLFTYLIPLIPLFYAWDGSISGMRIYSEKDLKTLLSRLPEKDGYTWESGIVKGKVPMTYILGLPKA
ncbi:MAG TPA: hypothetical protein DCE41_07540 [Cytophagales bacterium]|nr:hypothetical protein [Cytophagales bacterium]HAA23041.1 hypothetical protein [Cytophagales bacterium]HAP62086.1 hypothetical protein [Cytophagales bacterium]